MIDDVKMFTDLKGGFWIGTEYTSGFLCDLMIVILIPQQDGSSKVEMMNCNPFHELKNSISKVDYVKNGWYEIPCTEDIKRNYMSERSGLILNTGGISG